MYTIYLEKIKKTYTDGEKKTITEMDIFCKIREMETKNQQNGLQKSLVILSIKIPILSQGKF